MVSFRIPGAKQAPLERKSVPDRESLFFDL
jgi:hypothetical protein